MFADIENALAAFWFRPRAFFIALPGRELQCVRPMS
jgi:hypothetical protein